MTGILSPKHHSNELSFANKVLYQTVRLDDISEEQCSEMLHIECVAFEGQETEQQLSQALGRVTVSPKGLAAVASRELKLRLVLPVLCFCQWTERILWGL
jgi:hypothetical protein